MNKIFTIIYNVFKLVATIMVIVILFFNVLFIAEVETTLKDIDNKTSLMASAFINYHKITIETMSLLLKGQISTVGFVKELQTYIFNKSTEIEKQIKEKTMLPNFTELIKSNVVIVNKTSCCMGSGTIIKVKDKCYILSAAHLTDDSTDELYVKEGDETRPIKINKINRKIDLALFTYTNDYYDLTIAKISDKEPIIGDRVWTIGNPAGLEDAITSGSIVRKIGINYLIDAKIYFGSSGGGLFNNKGELIGVNVEMMGPNPVKIGKIDYMLGASVQLTIINAFIDGTIDSEI